MVLRSSQRVGILVYVKREARLFEQRLERGGGAVVADGRTARVRKSRVVHCCVSRKAEHCATACCVVPFFTPLVLWTHEPGANAAAIELML